MVKFVGIFSCIRSKKYFIKYELDVKAIWMHAHTV